MGVCGDVSRWRCGWVSMEVWVCGCMGGWRVCGDVSRWRCGWVDRRCVWMKVHVGSSFTARCKLCTIGPKGIKFPPPLPHLCFLSPSL